MIRILIADDQELVRSGFRIILDTVSDFEVVGEASNGQEAIELAASLAPDVICMDVEMPVLDGIAASRTILQSTTETADSAAATTKPAILILTTFGHEQYLFEALAAGVSGFLLKTSRAEQLIDAVRALASGEALLGPEVTLQVIARVQQQGASNAFTSEAQAEVNADQAGVDEAQTGVNADQAEINAAQSVLDEYCFTDREAEVLQLLALGKSNSEIASQLFLGESTVKTHVSNLLRKLGVRDRIQAVVWAHTNGVANL